MNRNVLLHVTNKCNMHCMYCYNKDKSRHGELQTSSIEGTNNLIRELQQQGDRIRLTLIGGEPSVVPNLCRELIESMPYDRLQVMTNAYAWSTVFKEALLYAKDRLQLTISFDGLFQDLRKPDSTEYILKSIKWVREHNIRANITCTCCPSHKGKVFDNLIYLTSFGLDVNYKRNCDHVLWEMQEDYQEVIKELGKAVHLAIYHGLLEDICISLPSRIEQGLSCTCAQRSGGFSCDEYVANDIVIDVDGLVYPCEMYAAYGLHSLGHVCTLNAKILLEKQDLFRCQKDKKANVCPFYNEIITGDPTDCAVVNTTADARLWEYREHFDYLRNRINELT